MLYYNQNNNFSVLGEVPPDDINDSVGTAEKDLILTLLNPIQSFFWVYITMVMKVISM